MFGIFQSAPYPDPVLGELKCSRGKWRGTISPDGAGPVALALSGDRKQPDEEALALAHTLQRDFPGFKAALETELFDHYTTTAEGGDAELPQITASPSVWPQVTLQFVHIAPLGGTLTVELGYAVSWDDDHTLGARFQDGKLVELNGSILPP